MTGVDLIYLLNKYSFICLNGKWLNLNNITEDDRNILEKFNIDISKIPPAKVYSNAKKDEE